MVAIVGRGGGGGRTDGRSLITLTRYRYRRTGGKMVAVIGPGGGGRTDGRLLVTLTRYKAANTENEYSGAELAV